MLVNLCIGCTCNNMTTGKFNPDWGRENFGRCQSMHKDYFGDEKFCYVDMPTTCTDIKEGTKGHKMSVQACDDCSVPANNVQCNNDYLNNNTHKNNICVVLHRNINFCFILQATRRRK